MTDPKNPWGPAPGADKPRLPRRWGLVANVAVVLLLVGYVVADVVKDLRQPTGFSFLRDYYLKPSLKAVVRRGPDGSAIVAVSGEIGGAAGPWFYKVIAGNSLQRGDTVLLSSPGGNLEAALALGRTIRAHGFNTAVGTLAQDAAQGSVHDGAQGSGILPSYCASACVFAFAGGVERHDIRGSRLGVHRFTVPNTANDDAVASAQETMGAILAYLAEMGVKPSLATETTKTSSIRWLDPAEAREMDLVTG